MTVYESRQLNYDSTGYTIQSIMILFSQLKITATCSLHTVLLSNILQSYHVKINMSTQAEGTRSAFVILLKDSEWVQTVLPV